MPDRPARLLLRPALVAAHVVALVCVGAAGWLGFWQLGSWQAQREADRVDVTALTPEPLADVMGPDDPFPGDAVGQPVVVDGTWVPGSSFLVSGREHDGRDGWWVVTALGVPDQDSPALFVVRGWTDQEQLPAEPTGRASTVAWLQPGEGTGAVDDDPTDDTLPQLRIGDAIQRVDQDVYSGYAVVADRAVPGDWPVGETAVNPGTTGLEPADLAQLPETGTFTAVRNLLYALEWWVFAAFAAFVWWRFVRDELRGGTDDGDEDGDPGDEASTADEDPTEHPVASRS